MDVEKVLQGFQGADKRIQIRVIAHKSRIEGIRNLIIDKLYFTGYNYKGQSKAMPCRRPNQDKVRVYLVFEVNQDGD